eukprot:TRINITY_DN3438_c0_g1_i2.p1 TRINITY_DN3438_c0_g1~~TRINITY_DN3438_c0_g1_i2.p1  ORF type:complete len:113 (+),score=28.38 TRINITY_DN3438_c0_g1_i2:357-695(+)
MGEVRLTLCGDCFLGKSTFGWSIHQILLDITGGGFSFLQLIIDAAFIIKSATVITGDLPKLALSLVSIVFDLLFIVQHYCLYKGAWEQVYEQMEEDDPRHVVKKKRNSSGTV